MEKIDQAQIEDVQKLLKEGMTQSEIGRKLNISRVTIHKIAHDRLGLSQVKFRLTELEKTVKAISGVIEQIWERLPAIPSKD